VRHFITQPKIDFYNVFFFVLPRQWLFWLCPPGLWHYVMLQAGDDFRGMSHLHLQGWRVWHESWLSYRGNLVGMWSLKLVGGKAMVHYPGSWEPWVGKRPLWGAHIFFPCLSWQGNVLKSQKLCCVSIFGVQRYICRATEISRSWYFRWQQMGALTARRILVNRNLKCRPFITAKLCRHCTYSLKASYSFFSFSAAVCTEAL
jgi:hypothetical protein